MAKIPVFVVHGFLESGKTRFVQETLADDYFSGGERNLVIACEEGVEEYEDELLQKTNTTLVVLEDKSEFNEMFLAECQTGLSAGNVYAKGMVRGTGHHDCGCNHLRCISEKYEIPVHGDGKGF